MQRPDDDSWNRSRHQPRRLHHIEPGRASELASSRRASWEKVLYLLAPAFVTGSGYLGSLPSRALVPVAQVVVGIDPNLLVGGELQHMVVLLLWRRAAHLGRARIGPQDHRLAMMETVTRAIGEVGARGFARKLCGQELVCRQLTVGIVLHRPLPHLRRVRRRI